MLLFPDLRQTWFISKSLARHPRRGGLTYEPACWLERGDVRGAILLWLYGVELVNLKLTGQKLRNRITKDCYERSYLRDVVHIRVM